MHKRTAERALKRLADTGLAEKSAAGWRRGPAEVETLARSLRSAGATERRKARHHHEREAYRRQYEELPWRGMDHGAVWPGPPDPVWWEADLADAGAEVRLAASWRGRPQSPQRRGPKEAGGKAS
jgi:hypothetical protein